MSDLTDFVVRCGGYVEDSRLAVLGGLFCYMVLVSGSDEATGDLVDLAADAEEATGLRIDVRPAERPKVPAGISRLQILIAGADREGMLHELAEMLDQHGANIVDMGTVIYPAPISGTPLFRINLTFDVATTALDDTQKALNAFAQQEDVDLQLTAQLG